MARETVENTQAQAQGIGRVNMNTIHFVLDMIGMVPVLGEFADAANVVLYMAEGNYKMAALSAAAMVPIIGNLATGGKMVSKVVGKLDTAKYADFDKAGLVEETYYLTQDLYKASDRKQFQYLDELRGGKAEGKTWHHNEEEPGRMDLVPFGIHNVTYHYGGRSKGNWAHGKR